MREAAGLLRDSLVYQHLEPAGKDALMRTLMLNTCSHRQPEQHGPWPLEEEGA